MPATACVLRRQRDAFRDVRFVLLGSISVAHLYNLRNSAPYRAQRVVLVKTRSTKAVTIGVRKAPASQGRPGFIRIDSTSMAPRACITSTRWTTRRSGRWWSPSRRSPMPTCCPSLSRWWCSSRSISWGFTPTTAASTSTTKSPAYWQATHRVHPQPPAAQQRQRFGGDQERRGSAEALWLRANSAAPRQALQHLLRGILQSVLEFPSALPVRHRAGRSQEARAHQAGVLAPGRDDARTSWSACQMLRGTFVLVKTFLTCRHWPERSPMCKPPMNSTKPDWLCSDALPLLPPDCPTGLSAGGRAMDMWMMRCAHRCSPWTTPKRCPPPAPSTTCP